MKFQNLKKGDQFTFCDDPSKTVYTIKPNKDGNFCIYMCSAGNEIELFSVNYFHENVQVNFKEPIYFFKDIKVGQIFSYPYQQQKDISHHMAIKLDLFSYLRFSDMKTIIINYNPQVILFSQHTIYS